MKQEPRTRERCQLASRLFIVAAVLNVVAALCYALLHRWLFVAVWGALAGATQCWPSCSERLQPNADGSKGNVAFA